MSTDKPITADLTAILEIEKKFKTQKRKLFEGMSGDTEKMKRESLKNVKLLKKQLSEISTIEQDAEIQPEAGTAEERTQISKELSLRLHKNVSKAEELLDKYLLS